MNKAGEFLNECKTFYIATTEDNQPRVRPFGAVAEFDGKLYICTNNKKNVFKQIQKNPRIEISGMSGDKWIRLSAEAIPDQRTEARKAMLDAYPSLNNMYSLDDGIFEVLYLKNATVSIHSFSGEPEVFAF